MAEPDFRWTQDEWDKGAKLNSGSHWSEIQTWTIRHARLFRVLILVLGAVVFELSANAALATVVSCLEFGRIDFGTAWWLRRRDPDPIRSSICQRCYLAWGLCRVSLVALNVILVIVIGAVVINECGFGPVDPPDHLMGAFGLIAFTLTLASGLSILVVFGSLRHGIKIWLGPEPRWARQQGVWPPSAVDQPRGISNQAKIIFYMGCFSWMFPTSVFAMFRCLLVPSMTGWLSFLGIVILILIAALMVVSQLERRVLARTPAECWPLDAGGALPTL